MEQRSIPLPKEIMEKLIQYDGSIGHFSAEYTMHSLTIKAMLDNIDSLCQARHQMMDSFLKEAGIDPTLVMQMKTVKSDNPELILIMKPTHKSP